MSGPDVTDNNQSEQLQTAFKSLEDLVEASQVRQSKLRWISRGLTVAIVVVLGIYIFMIYSTLNNNLSSEKFNQSIQTHTAEMIPVITDASMEVIVGASPKYLELANKKLENIMPSLLVSLEKQADIFISNMSVFGQKESHARLMKILNQVALEMKKQFPDLTDEQLVWFVEESEDDLKEAFAQVAEHILDQTLPEIMEMKYLSESMVDRNLPKDEMELVRLFLHKLLLQVDKEILEDRP
ncbi:MAG: hypothetical protein HQK55_13190 [Deltaproteobacteria bacterium]|nr:hypothetical protein [Deltaproteobacteria bacterium]